MNLPELGPDEQIAEQLEREHVRAAYVWKGKQLWPYCLQSRIVLAQTWGGEESQAWKGMGFVYVHIKRGRSKFEEDVLSSGILEAIGNGALFKMKVLKWMETEQVTDADMQEAIRIFEESDEADRATRVALVDTRTEEEKMRDEARPKKKEACPESPPSEPIASPNPSGSIPET